MPHAPLRQVFDAIHRRAKRVHKFAYTVRVVGISREHTSSQDTMACALAAAVDMARKHVAECPEWAVGREPTAYVSVHDADPEFGRLGFEFAVTAAGISQLRIVWRHGDDRWDWREKRGRDGLLPLHEQVARFVRKWGTP